MRRTNSRIYFDDDISKDMSHAVNPLFISANIANTANTTNTRNTTYIDMKTQNIENITNPMYDWYQPNMTRKECTQYLLAQGEGSFIVRDSTATPGWHMLGVKMNNEVIHEKIRFTEDGMYEILSSKTDKKQPTFGNLAGLIEYYLHPQEDSPYCLAMSNPLYDNHHLTNNHASYELATDFDAPVLPLKDNQVENITNIAHSSLLKIKIIILMIMVKVIYIQIQNKQKKL